jgi:hypothetical protein
MQQRTWIALVGGLGALAGTALMLAVQPDTGAGPVRAPEPVTPARVPDAGAVERPALPPPKPPPRVVVETDLPEAPPPDDAYTMPPRPDTPVPPPPEIAAPLSADVRGVGQLFGLLQPHVNACLDREGLVPSPTRQRIVVRVTLSPDADVTDEGGARITGFEALPAEGERFDGFAGCLAPVLVAAPFRPLIADRPIQLSWSVPMHRR